MRNNLIEHFLKNFKVHAIREERLGEWGRMLPHVLISISSRCPGASRSHRMMGFRR